MSCKGCQRRKERILRFARAAYDNVILMGAKGARLSREALIKARQYENEDKKTPENS